VPQSFALSNLSKRSGKISRSLALAFLALMPPMESALAKASCEPGRVMVEVLGSGGPELDDQRASSGYLVWLDGKARVLVDIGSGSMLNFERSGARIEHLDALLLSHLHVDHSADLPALVKASYFSNRRRELPVFGPEGNFLMPATSDWLDRLFGPDGAYRYLQEYLQPDQRSAYKLRPVDIPAKPAEPRHIELNKAISLAAIPTHHGPIPALGWRVDLAGCGIVFSGDMSNRNLSLSKIAQGADLLVAHNAVPQGIGGVARNLHMTPDEIGRIAADAGVSKVVLSHRMRRTLGREEATLSEIQKRYNGEVRFADDQQRFDPASQRHN